MNMENTRINITQRQSEDLARVLMDDNMLTSNNNINKNITLISTPTNTESIFESRFIDHNINHIDTRYGYKPTIDSDLYYRKYKEEKEREESELKELINYLKLNKDIKINKNANNTSSYRFNKNGYLFSLEGVLTSYNRLCRYAKIRNLNNLIYEQSIKEIKNIYEIFLYHNFFLKNEKAIQIKVKEIKLKNNNISIIVESENTIIEIIFNTSRQRYSLLDTSIAMESKLIRTYSVEINVEIEKNINYNINMNTSTNVGINRQDYPEKSINRTIVFEEPSHIDEIKEIRSSVGKIEKLISIIKSNINFLEDLLRIVLNGNELKSLLHMFKIKLELMSDYGFDISREIHDSATIMNNIISLVEQKI